MTAGAHLTSSRRHAAAVWLALVTGAVAAIALLHRLGAEPEFAVEWPRLWAWLGEHSIERALLGPGRLAALLLAYWLAGSTLLYTAARATALPGLIRSVEWMTLPAVRRVAGRVVALSLTVSTLGPAAAALATADPEAPDAVEPFPAGTVEPGPRHVPVPAGDVLIAPPAEDAGSVPTSAGPDEPEPASPRPSLAGGPDPGPERVDDDIDPGVRRAGAAHDTATERAVRPGDHLWGIAEAHLAHVLARGPSDVELATYWAHLVEVNRPRLRSGNPDLIFPGEAVTCPPTEDVGISP